MEEIQYRFDCDGLAAGALEEVFHEAGLGGRGGDKIRRAFHNSSRVCLAFAGGRLVGCARAITDGEYHAVIYDVAVRPEFQRRGIGKSMVGSLLERLPVWRVLLVADNAVQPFYRRFGFAPYSDVMARFDRTRLFDAP